MGVKDKIKSKGYWFQGSREQNRQGGQKKGVWFYRCMGDGLRMENEGCHIAMKEQGARRINFQNQTAAE